MRICARVQGRALCRWVARSMTFARSFPGKSKSGGARLSHPVFAPLHNPAVLCRAGWTASPLSL